MVHKLDVYRPDGDVASLSGILADGKDLTVFTTHGMGWSNLSYNDTLRAGVAEQLGFSAVGKPEYFTSRDSRLRIEYFERDGQKLTFYNQAWFPVTQNRRWALSWSDRIEERLETMDGIKQSLLNHSLSDVVMYQGSSRGRILNGITDALNRMAVRQPGDNFAIVTDSLGSKIFLDAMNMGYASGADWAVQIGDQIKVFYMLANQLALLDLGDSQNPLQMESASPVLRATDRANFEKPVGQESIAVEELFASLHEFTRHPKGDPRGAKVRLIAITDPNDLLSYPIPSRAVDEQRYVVTNVYLSVARAGYSWPFGKPQIVNPLKAHTHYLEDSRVLNVIINGK